MLEHQNGSVLDTSVLSVSQVLELFRQAQKFEQSGWPNGCEFDSDGSVPTVCLLFFEPSTRTRMSFQIASYRLGLQVQTMELGPGSSLAKGETLEDTIFNFAAMRPDLMVVRHSGAKAIDELLKKLKIPVLSAGSGAFSHPTQSLLDAYTLWTEWKENLARKKVLIVGDIRHSRVAASARELFPRLGIDLKFAGPIEWLPSDCEPNAVVELNSGLKWCDAVMGLRVQFERHSALIGLSPEDRAARIAKLGSDYHREFGLDQKRLQHLSEKALILHPGPINHGVEFAQETALDPRSRVLSQVTSGVYIRAALLHRALSVSLPRRNSSHTSLKGDRV